VIRILAPLALLVVALVLPAQGEHELFYRYTVLGYVKDAAGTPRPGRTLELTRDKTGFSYLGDTDAAGLYLIVARLGDESVGESLTLRLDQRRLPLVVRFDPANHTDERGTRVDVQGDRFIERPDWFRSTLARLLVSPRTRRRLTCRPRARVAA
jgi:hypothetical protein